MKCIEVWADYFCVILVIVTTILFFMGWPETIDDTQKETAQTALYLCIMLTSLGTISRFGQWIHNQRLKDLVVCGATIVVVATVFTMMPVQEHSAQELNGWFVAIGLFILMVSTMLIRYKQKREEEKGNGDGDSPETDGLQ